MLLLRGMKEDKKLQMGALGQKFPTYPTPQRVDGYKPGLQQGSHPQGQPVQHLTRQMG